MKSPLIASLRKQTAGKKVAPLILWKITFTPMNFKIIIILFSVFFFSCKDNNEAIERAEIIKQNKEKELVFATLNKNWNFPQRTLTPESQTIANNWNEWRVFTSELYQKPKTTIGAFQRKSRNLVQKAEVLNSTIPIKLDKPPIKARLMAIITKVKALNTFINLDKIPEKKVVTLVSDLNIEVNAFQDQIEEIVRRSQIQFEEGEEEMIQRAGGKIIVPSSEKNQSLQQNGQGLNEIK